MSEDIEMSDLDAYQLSDGEAIDEAVVRLYILHNLTR